MEINYNPTVLRDVRLPEIIEFETETYLTSESNTFVCFDGTATRVIFGIGTNFKKLIL